MGSSSRKLAAIVVADVVGYSRLMERDETRTRTQVRSLTEEIVGPVTERFRGRVVKGTGDGWLADFASVTDALFSSLDIQAELSARQARVPKARRLLLRIGVSLGEVIFEGDDVFGTGVNLAARLESIAKPGGVCVSDWVHEQVRGLPGLRIEDMGSQPVKNLAMPVRSYMVYRRPTRTAQPAVPAPPTAEPPAALGGASIAVLPFANLSGDPGQDYFADGMVDDILTALARFKSLAVIARQSSFVYRGRAVDVREVGRELGVRYVLEGSVQRSASRVRITAQLIDATNGAHVWADRFEGDPSDLFDLQDRLTERVVGTLEPQIRRAEIERARRTRPESLHAYDLYLQALPHAYAMRPADNTRGLALLLGALELDPSFAPAQAFAAWCYEQRVTRGWPTVQPGDAERAVALARSTIAADTGDANVISIAGFVLVMVGREYDTGLAALRDAVRLNPCNTFALMNAGWAEVFAGSLAEGLGRLERAFALSPRDPAAFYVMTGLAMVHLLSRQFPEAAAMAEASAALYGEWDATQMVLAASLALAGRPDDARLAVARLAQLLEGTSVSRMLGMLPIRDPERRAILEEGLAQAGVPL